MKISGAGCCLLDSVFNEFDIHSEKILPLLSKNPGDGGLKEGGLVFFDSIQNYSGMSHDDLYRLLSNGKEPVVTNLGGPAIVAMVNVAQMLEGSDSEVVFEGIVGDDSAGSNLMEVVKATPLKYSIEVKKGGVTPKTMVLAGNGERTFVNDIGVAHEMTYNKLSDGFFKSDIVLLGGTAIVPELHKNLSNIVARVKKNGGVTVVGTVYDYISEQKDASKPWSFLVENNWNDIDILVMDAEEALRISGKTNLDEAAVFFENKVQSFIITQGSKSIWVWAGGDDFVSQSLIKLPVSEYVDFLLKSDSSLRHDSTGCGDNFAGGVVSSVARQKTAGCKKIDIVDCCIWGASCGGYTLFYNGGTYIEKCPGEKLEHVQKIVSEYKKQIGRE